MAMIIGYGIVMLGVCMLGCVVPTRRARSTLNRRSRYERSEWSSNAHLCDGEHETMPSYPYASPRRTDAGSTRAARQAGSDAATTLTPIIVAETTASV
jgi:hypothetical protein